MRGILSGVGGNISIRTNNPNIIICSPSGIPIMDMLFSDLCIVDISEIKEWKYKVLMGEHKPTSEILTHGGIYKNRSEIKSIIHSHPPFVTAYACTEEKINFKIQEDQRWYIGDISFLPFVISSSKDLAIEAVPKLKKNYALILSNHGLIALGNCLAEAVNITELVEDLARVSFYANYISGGNVKELPSSYWTDVKIETRKDLIYHDEIFDK
jgi:ribulose-5-phosphate 4-epimerase/fuculose-1-phosphate aldolase